jgi:hypothetical protein
LREKNKFRKLRTEILLVTVFSEDSNTEQDEIDRLPNFSLSLTNLVVAGKGSACLSYSLGGGLGSGATSDDIEERGFLLFNFS